MTGLRGYERDLGLARQVDGERLLVPRSDEIGAWVGRYLAGESGSVAAVALEFARWKPGVALTTVWRIDFQDGTQCLVTQKGYVGAKGQHVARHYVPDGHTLAACAPHAPFAALPERGAYLMVFPADRVLRGASRVLNLRRLARRLDRTGIWPGWVMRLRASRLQVLRYKPERRAVFRLEARLRKEEEGRSERLLALRVLDPTEARRVAERRRELDLECAPRLLHLEEESGLLVEEWLPGSAGDPTCYDDAREAGRLLARLHGWPLPEAWEGACGTPDLGLDPLRIDPDLAQRAQALVDLGPEQGLCAIHGDFHPDQVLRLGADRWLLDLDTLRLGRPEEDLASWIAGQMDVQPALGFEEAGAELLDAYLESGGLFDPALLRRLVGNGLVARAAGGIRRLERGALEKARLRIERACEVRRCAVRGSEGPA